MKNFYLFLLAVFILPLFSFGQSNYKPGYVVTLTGDTVKGFIDYREWNSNPTSINFKTTVTDTKTHKYTPTEINFFTINGMEAYVRYSGPITMDATDINHLSTSRDTSFHEVIVFFKILQKGNNLALYSYTDDIKSRFFVGEAPGYIPKELVYRRYRDGSTINENTYMKRLFALANKYQALNPSLQLDIERMEYNGAAILDIVSKINHISAADEKRNNNKASAFNLFAGVALNITNFNAAAGSPFYNAGGRSNSSYLAGASFGINIFANPNTRRLQFRIEAGIAESRFKSLYTSKVYPYIPFRASFDAQTFSITPQIIYNFYNGDKFKVYGGLGVSFNYFTYSNSYLGSQSQPNSASDVEANEPYLFNSSDDSIVIKAGVQLGKHLGIFAQYLSSININKNAYWQLSFTSEQAGINYYF
ncbi:MAG: hypothetical protein JWR09_1198 [Mucilaginibacter sp.]|nr:hypothetical protein [Mucilaginibacter sp.]